MVCCSCFSSAIWRQIAKLQGGSQRRVDWSEVPADVWWQIATRLDSCKDFLTFRGVCHSWRSLVDAKDFRQSERNPPWLSLLVCTVRVWPQTTVRWFFYSLRRRKFHQITWPELVGTRKKCFSSKGWICIVDENVEENLDINLVHPLSLARISLRGFKCCDHSNFIYKVVLAASPSHSEDFMAMVIHGSGKQVAIWRQGEDQKGWTCLSTEMGPCSDVAYYGAQLYTLHDDGGSYVVLVYDVSRRPNPVQVRSVPLLPFDDFPLRYRAYFVESSGKLLAVIRYSVEDFTTDSWYLTRAFIVFEFDVESGEWKKLLDLGDRSLFVGENSSFALQITSHASGFKPNCIYFTPNPHDLFLMLLHYRGNNREMGVYNLQYRHVRHSILPKFCPKITSAQWIESSPC